MDDVKKKFSGYSRKQDNNSLSSLNVSAFYGFKVFVRANTPIFFKIKFIIMFLKR